MVLKHPSSVPEPSTLAMSTMGALDGLLLFRRRKYPSSATVSLARIKGDWIY
jgi:hypothetical protein